MVQVLWLALADYVPRKYVRKAFINNAPCSHHRMTVPDRDRAAYHTLEWASKPVDEKRASALRMAC